MISITAEKRDIKTNADSLRKNGRVPAVIYGRKQQSTPISLNLKEFEKILSTASETTVVSINGDAGNHDVLIHDVQRDPVTDKVRHADLYVLEKDRKVKVRVPLVFEGLAPAVKDFGGTLVKVMYDLEIEALPKDLPSSLTVDVTKLANLDSQLFAKDINLPSGVLLIEKSEEVVASIAEYKEEEEAPAMDISQIEVEKKGKVDEEGAEAAASEEPKTSSKKE
jgi:large subunit ribosomal protein L25